MSTILTFKTDLVFFPSLLSAGCGAYCDNAYGAVSTTGHGENIMKVTLSKTIISYMEHLGITSNFDYSSSFVYV